MRASTAEAHVPLVRFDWDTLTVRVAAWTAWSFVLEGPLRWALNMVGGDSLLYIRDLAAVVVFGGAVLRWLSGRSRYAFPVVVLAVLLVHLLIGLLTIPSPFQVFFGFKTHLLFAVGLCAAPAVARDFPAFVRFVTAAALVTYVGVALNALVEYPWVGQSYDTAFGEVVAAKQWWTTGETARLPGFARVSSTAATITVVAAAPLLSGALPRWTKLATLVVVLHTIQLTTSKGAWTGLAATIALITIWNLRDGVRLASLAIATEALICLALPLVAVQIGGPTASVPDILYSFMDRIQDMWPRSFALLGSPMQWIWGRGLGGIGVAQTFDEWSRAAAADNMMVYTLVTFGVLGVLYVGALLTGALRWAERARGAWAPVTVLGWTGAWLAYGFTAANAESALMHLTMGLAFGLSHVEPEA